ncbi:hypothetical protein J27TS7_44820 [Paenibacillus dendritiformis]|nr:hypothetical protein J27TS7_44820 [Paenibacillus dendritiformis]
MDRSGAPNFQPIFAQVKTHETEKISKEEGDKAEAHNLTASGPLYEGFIIYAGKEAG